MRWLGATALALLAATSGCRPATVAPAAPTAPDLAGAANSDLASIERDVVRWTNVQRLSRGLDPLAWNDVLARVARDHSAEMVRLGYFGHESPVAGRRTPLQRVQGAGFRPRSLVVGENVSRVSERPNVARAIVDLWMESEGHRRNILRARFRHVGVGVVVHGNLFYTTQVFGAWE